MSEIKNRIGTEGPIQMRLHFSLWEVSCLEFFHGLKNQSVCCTI